MKVGRNDPCHCGSGEKYKKCHLQKDEAAESAALAKEAKKRAKQAEADAAAAAESETAEGGAPRAAAPRAALPPGPGRNKTDVSPRPPPRRRRAGA